MSRLPIDLSIARPCTQQWSAMTGSKSERHCDSCNKQVHNFAMLRPQQIEELFAFSPDGICGRIAHRPDGTAVTAGEPERARFAALAALVPLSFASIASAQSSDPPQAFVSGSILRPTNFPEIGKYVVTLSQNGKVKTQVVVDSTGKWNLTVPTGIYDLGVQALMFSSAHLEIDSVNLHQGEQIFGSMALADQPDYQTVTVGEIVSHSNFYRNIFYRVRHPIRYFAYLRQRYL